MQPAIHVRINLSPSWQKQITYLFTSLTPFTIRLLSRFVRGIKVNKAMEADDTYSDVHRHFIQYLLKRQCILKSKALRDLVTICEACAEPSVTDFDAFVAKINEKISHDHFKIVETKFGPTGDVYVLLTITSINDEKPTNVEIKFFYKILHEIMESDEKAISDYRPMAQSLRINPTKSNVLVQKKVKEGYLYEDENDMICLGPLALVQCLPYIRQHFNDALKTCPVCLQHLLKGRTCDQCTNIMHEFCVTGNSGTCPTCEE